MSLKLERQLIAAIREDMERISHLYDRFDDVQDIASHVVDIGQLTCLTAQRVVELEARIEALEKSVDG